MADASFHLSRNAVQVQSWIALLEGDALKRCRRDRKSDRCFWAVPRILIVVRAMLEGEVGRRPSAKRVRRCFGGALKVGFGDLGVHCGKGGNGSGKKGEKDGKREKVDGGGGGGGGSGYGRNLEVIGEEGGGFGSTVSVAPSASVAPSIVPSESASEFDFGFEDTGSGTESAVDESEDETEHEREKGPQIKVEEEESDEDVSEDEPEIHVDRVSPQLYLPELDVNITGIEGMMFAN
jgi:hypothetical protein